MSIKILPQELIVVILGHVCEDKRVLPATSLTARIFVPASQIWLFEAILLDLLRTFNSLVLAFLKSPQLLLLVKRLTVSGGILLPYLGPSHQTPHGSASKAKRVFDLAVFIDCLKCLEYFELSSPSPPLTACQWSWNDINPPLLPAIEALIWRPNLQQLSLSGFEHVPIDLLDAKKMGQINAFDLPHVNFDRHQVLNGKTVPLVIKCKSISFDLDPARRIFGGSTENNLQLYIGAQSFLGAATLGLRRLSLRE